MNHVTSVFISSISVALALVSLPGHAQEPPGGAAVTTADPFDPFKPVAPVAPRTPHGVVPDAAPPDEGIRAPVPTMPAPPAPMALPAPVEPSPPPATVIPKIGGN